MPARSGGRPALGRSLLRSIPPVSFRTFSPYDLNAGIFCTWGSGVIMPSSLVVAGPHPDDSNTPSAQQRHRSKWFVINYLQGKKRNTPMIPVALASLGAPKPPYANSSCQKPACQPVPIGMQQSNRVAQPSVKTPNGQPTYKFYSRRRTPTSDENARFRQNAMGGFSNRLLRLSRKKIPDIHIICSLPRPIMLRAYKRNNYR